MKKILTIVSIVLFIAGIIYVVNTLNSKPTTQTKESDPILELYTEKAKLIKDRRAIMIRKQNIDKEYNQVQSGINAIDEQLKGEINSGLEQPF